MSHRIKKRPIINHNNYGNHNQLLHSDKSTYTALRFGPLSGRKLSNRQRPVLFSPEKRGFREKMKSYGCVGKTYDAYFYKNKIGGSDCGDHSVRSFFSLWRSLAHRLVSKARYCFTNNRTLSITPLMLSTFALLLVLGMMIMPMGISGESVYALDNVDSNITNDEASNDGISLLAASPNSKISFSIKHNGAVVADNGTVSTEVTAGVVNYISNTIEITTTDINKFYVSVQAAEGSPVNLVGTKYRQEILPVGENTPVSSFGDNTWGYALSDNTSLAASALTYNPLPTYSEVPPIQYTSSSNLTNGTHTLALVFAAKINANKPADNYTTRAMVSVVADAKDI